MDLPIKISPKMVFVCKTDSLGRDNLNRFGRFKKNTQLRDMCVCILVILIFFNFLFLHTLQRLFIKIGS
jgi:hypothetical protein